MVESIRTDKGVRQKLILSLGVLELPKDQWTRLAKRIETIIHNQQTLFEETTEMEMPILERNLVILSTIASIATLTGLLGTVLGMVKAFAALAHEGAPDAIGLAKGISEALMSTALGIGISMLAIVLYNYLTTRIDNLMYLTAETGQMIVRTLTHHHSDE